MRDLAGLFGGAGDIRQAVMKAISDNNALKHQVDDFMKERVATLTKAVLDRAREINGVRVVELFGIRMPEIVKTIAFNIKSSAPEHTVFAASTQSEGRPMLTLYLSDDIVKEGYNAGKIIRDAAKLIKGGGGGQPFFAQAGGKDSDGLSAAHAAMLAALNLQ